MRKIMVSGLFAIATVGLAYAADMYRHANYGNPKAPTGAAECKGFYGTDDNLTACNDFCEKWKTDNEARPAPATTVAARATKRILRSVRGNPAARRYAASWKMMPIA